MRTERENEIDVSTVEIGTNVKWTGDNKFGPKTTRSRSGPRNSDRGGVSD